MPSFGRSLSRFGVDYLLVSGQASVLYQAATFSEGVDLWVRADAGNLKRLRKALASLRARPYPRPNRRMATGRTLACRRLDLIPKCFITVSIGM